MPLAGKMRLVLVLAAMGLLQAASAANILALVTLPSRSHHIWNRVWVRALAERGHHVTTLSPDLEGAAHPNHRQLIIEGAYNYHENDEEGNWDFQKMSEDGPLTSLSMMHMWGKAMCVQAFGTEGMRKLKALRNETFDLIVVEIAASECFLGLVPYFGSPPVLAVTAFHNPTWSSYMLGGVETPSFVPGILVPHVDKMDFRQRLENTVFYYGMHFLRNYLYLPAVDEIVRANFDEPVPSVAELELNISLILVNTDASMDYPRPLLPAMVPVGGLHIKPTKPLPKDLQKFMDEAPDGVIFFSLGSNVRSDLLGAEKDLQKFMDEAPDGVIFFSLGSNVRSDSLGAEKDLQKFMDEAPDGVIFFSLGSNVRSDSLGAEKDLQKFMDEAPDGVIFFSLGSNVRSDSLGAEKDLQKFMDEAPDGVIFFSLGSNVRSDSLGAEKVSSLTEAFRSLPQRVLWKWESDSLPGRPENVLVAKWLPQSDILGHPNLRLFVTHGGLLSLQEAVARAVPVLGIPIFADQHANMERAVHHGVGERIAINRLTSHSFAALIKQVLDNPKYRENMQKASRIFHDQPQSPLERAMFWIEYVIRHRGAPHLRSAGADLAWYQYHLLDVLAVVVLGLVAVLATLWFVLRALAGRLLFGGQKAKQKRQ